MYLNTLSSISGDDLTIKPDTRRNLLLEVSGNNNIIIKRGNVSYNLSSLIIGDISFSNFDISNNINPVTNNNGSLGTSSKLWGNAYIRDISVTNMSVSGTISTFREIIPQITNDISTSLGNSSNMWQKAFIRDLSGITRINGTAWPIIGPSGATGQNGTPGGPGPPGPSPPGPPGPPGALGVSINATLTDISNFRITTKNRIYQEISGGINDLSWAAVNGYYGLAKNAYPSLNPLSSGAKASTWRGVTITNPSILTTYWSSTAWSPSLGLFVCVGIKGTGTTTVMTSRNGINWNPITIANSNITDSQWYVICWSPELNIFVAGSLHGPSPVRFMTSNNGVNWTPASYYIGVPVFAIVWSSQLGIFVALMYTSWLRILTSTDGSNWTERPLPTSPQNLMNSNLEALCWSPELGLFVAVATDGVRAIHSKNGINWSSCNVPASCVDVQWVGITWSGQLGIFVSVARAGGPAGSPRIMTSYDGINWTARGLNNERWLDVCWSAELELFVIVTDNDSIPNRVKISPDGINWTFASSGPPLISNYLSKVIWCPELGIFLANGGGNFIITISSLKARPPTSYNVFDSSFNRIDENGKWDFSNINVTTLTVDNGPPITSDDRLKHNEVNINNGLDVIDKLTPKFYQKTQVLLDASYNGDLSGYAWTLEAGLIAQELLKINDLSFTVGGGDYYEQTYIIRNSNYDLSANNYEVSANNYEPSANNYKLRYNYYEPNANNYEVSANNYEVSANNYEISNNLIAQPYYVNYNSIFVYGLAAIKELHTKVKAQETSILDEQLNDLVTRVEALESNRQDVSNNSA
jgi:hypothetical protein